jgi:hypothetical protein
MRRRQVTSRSDRFTHVKRTPGTLWVRSCVSSTVCLDTIQKREISARCLFSTLIELSNSDLNVEHVPIFLTVYSFHFVIHIPFFTYITCVIKELLQINQESDILIFIYTFKMHKTHWPQVETYCSICLITDFYTKNIISSMFDSHF